MFFLPSKFAATGLTPPPIDEAMGLSLAELFAWGQEVKELHSVDKSLMEKVTLLEALPEEERNTIFVMLDAFVGKRKLKNALQSVLQETN